MSIDVQTEIRNTCLYDGGHFAVLMAAADCANTATGEGIYPGIDLWAANARLKQRRTQDIIQELRADLVLVLQSENGEDLGPEVQPTGGRGRKTEYRIDLERVQELQGLHMAEVEAGRAKCHFCEARKKRENRYPRKGAIQSEKGAISDTKGAKNDVKGAISGSHIRTHEPIEPSVEPQEAPRRDLLGDLPPKPISPAEVLALAYEAYAETAARAGWPAVQKRTTSRDQHLKARLADADGLDGWRLALAKAEASDFLCGKVAPTPPRTEPMLADFDFLTNDTKFTRLMEGKYDNRKGGPTGPANGGSFLEAAGRDAAFDAAERPH